MDNKQLNIIKTTGKKKMKIKRNQKCPCGSGKKYKKCCYNTDYEKRITRINEQKLKGD